AIRRYHIAKDQQPARIWAHKLLFYGVGDFPFCFFEIRVRIGARYIEAPLHDSVWAESYKHGLLQRPVGRGRNWPGTGFYRAASRDNQRNQQRNQDSGEEGLTGFFLSTIRTEKRCSR